MLIEKKTFRWALIVLLSIFALMVIAAAIIRFSIFPNINQYKDTIATTISQKIGLKTTVGHIVTGWDGLSPKVLIRAIDIYDKDNQPALHLKNVNGTISWLSIPLLHPTLSQLSVNDPKLTIHRNTNGSLFIAGIPMTGEGEPVFANWLLSQAHIKINNAAIVWQDDSRKAPPLSLNQVDIRLDNPAWRKIFGQHLFNIKATPSTGTKYPIVLSGHFFGRDVSAINTWHGVANLDTKEVDLTAWKAWLDYPIDLQSGAGKAKINLSFDRGNILKLQADVHLNHLSVLRKQADQPLNAKLLSGLLTWEQTPKTSTIRGVNIQLDADDDFHIRNGSGFFSRSIKNNHPWVKADLELDSFDLNYLNKLQELVALPPKVNEALNALNPKGKLNNLSISLQGNPNQPNRYTIESTFQSLSIAPYQNMPGFSNISGEIKANEDSGTVILATSGASVDLKDTLRWPVPLDTLKGKVSWTKNKEKIKITANHITIANPHIQGELNGHYDLNGIKGGYLDLTGQFEDGDAKFAPFYYPAVMGEETIRWLDSAIVSGKANNIKIMIKGSLGDFPFIDENNQPDSALGFFKVTARISDAILVYNNDWPKIEGLGLNLSFVGNSMELNADAGKIYDINITQGKAIIPQLYTNGAIGQVLNIDGTGEGPISSGIQFINNSPVKDVALGFTDDLKTAGNGKLKLKLSLPLNKLNNSEYSGEYSLRNGAIYANQRLGLPEISNINGNLSFDASGIYAPKISGNTLGGPVQLSLKTTESKAITINASGTASGKGVQQFITNPLTIALSGNTNWSAGISIKKTLMKMDVRSNLQGLAIQLPAPFGKRSEEKAYLRFEKKQSQANQDVIKMAYKEVASAIFLRNEQDNTFTIDRGDIGINIPAKIPSSSGLSLHGKLDYVNADQWLALTKQSQSKNKSASLNVNSADITIKALDFMNRRLNDLIITSKPSNQHLGMHLSSQEIEGDLEWISPSKTEVTGEIIAKLTKLHLPDGYDKLSSQPADEQIVQLDQEYPALNIQVADFKLGEKNLGALEVHAHEIKNDWVIDQLKISNPDSILLAEGRWHNWTRSPNTNLTFSLSANDVGNTLKRFGQADIVKGGISSISGQLNWPGSPHQFKTKGLNGNFRLGAAKGQIIKVKPGVGRLFGLLTLQSLPRRLTLDFRDLFSEGFAFDEISGSAKITNGVMHSDDFFMTGPAAETKIHGDIDLNKETQQLNIKVTPHISDSLSLAALAGGPIVGAAAFIAQKLLKDPLNKIAQSEYTITGTWDNPVEEDTVKQQQDKQTSSSPLNAQ